MDRKDAEIQIESDTQENEAVQVDTSFKVNITNNFDSNVTFQNIKIKEIQYHPKLKQHFSISGPP